MKTHDLISALASDRLTASSPIERVIVAGALAGELVTGVAFLLSLGWRPDIGTAIGTVRFSFKFIVTLAVAAAAALLLVRLARPGVALGNRGLLLGLGPVLIAGGVLAELIVLPSSEWHQNLVGSNALLCVAAIPLLSIAPLVGLLVALRKGAPTRPVLTGAIAGLLSSAIAATLYASHCVDDSPLFIVVWYSLAIGIVTLLAAGIGGRLLRW